MRELARIAFLDPTNVVNMDSAELLDSATADDRAAIASIKVKSMSGDVGMVEREIKFADKIKALELLGKHYGMWVSAYRSWTTSHCRQLTHDCTA
ncbi:terminase small subunit [Paenibacillus chitinolyticus]|uniref:terminase small subunit n=1 Tax=Paenibacillus chitinolyticus TaxID=79263 RepID=UPI0036DCBFB1